MRVLPSLVWPGAAGPGLPQPSFSIHALTPAASPLAPVAQLFAVWLASRPCGSTLAGVGQCPLAIGHWHGCLVGLPVGVPPRVGSPTAPCTLSHLAGVGQCPPAISHGCLVGLLAGVLDRRPVSPLSSSPACSGAGSGWHCLMQIADSTVYLGGPATGGAGPLLCADSWAVTVWRIASAARLRRPRGLRAERGQSDFSSRHHCGCSLSQAGILPEPGPSWARSCTVPGTPCPAGSRPVACSPHILPVACSLLK